LDERSDNQEHSITIFDHEESWNGLSSILLEFFYSSAVLIEITRIRVERTIGSESYIVLKGTERCKSQIFWYDDKDDETENESAVSKTDETRQILALSGAVRSFIMLAY
jgi:hypothetical protein